MSHHVAKSGSAAPERESETFRQLVEKQISADEYVESLERRVRERHEDERNGHQDEPSEGEAA